MARITHGVPKADKQLHGVQIDWTGHPIRDGRGYFGDGETDVPAPKAGAFPPKAADFSRLRQSPVAAFAEQIACVTAPSVRTTQISGATPTTVTQQHIVDGAAVVDKPAKKPNKLVEYMTRIKADPEAFSQYLAKQKAGYRAWLAKRKAKK